MEKHLITGSAVLYEDRERLAVNVVGAFAAQEEVGMRGATVTSQVVKPDLAIVFEGSPSDDFYFSTAETQGRMRGGVQIRLMDKSYISNPLFIQYAEEVAKKYGIRYQETVRRGGSTNAGKISLTGKAVPVLVLCRRGSGGSSRSGGRSDPGTGYRADSAYLQTGLVEIRLPHSHRDKNLTAGLCRETDERTVDPEGTYTAGNLT